MRLPHTLGNGKISKLSCKRRVFGRTSVYAEPYFSVSLMQMTNPHLSETHAVLGTLNTVIVLTAAQTILHSFYC